MRRTVVLFALVLSFVTLARAQEPASTVAQGRPAQTPRPAPPAAPVASPVPEAPMPPRPPSAPEPAPTQNVSVQLSITDSLNPAAKKTVSMLVADKRNGRVRTNNGGAPLNVDISANVGSDGRIQLGVTLEYTTQESGGPVTNLNESLSVLLTEGKPAMISQSADPKTDRKVTVEVTANVAK